MKIQKQKVKCPPNFCFNCGCALETTEYILDLGTPAATFEFCRSCIRKLKDKAAKTLEAK
ncbi:MAG TPA: hypothetical protein PKB13_11525 [Clostridia bacterium]|nr:hypothetical protein [Clostridia bacterium]